MKTLFVRFSFVLVLLYLKCGCVVRMNGCEFLTGAADNASKSLSYYVCKKLCQLRRSQSRLYMCVVDMDALLSSFS
jgi:hypothetical protein